MNFLFLGNLGQGEIIIIAVIGIIVLILPVLLILLICGAFTSFPPTRKLWILRSGNLL